VNVLKPMPEMPEADDRVVPIGRDAALPPAIAPGAGRKTFRMFLVAALLVGGGVAFGMWRHSLAEAEVNATSEQRRGIVPAVRVTTVHASDGMTVALLPGSTGAFEVANIIGPHQRICRQALRRHRGSREAAVAVAQADIRAQQVQLEVLLQLKAYQRVVAPFDGVVTQRNIDNGSLMQADIAGGVPMFTVMHSDVIRVQTYVPQDQVSGLQKGVGAIVRVPEMPGVEFRGTVARVASALQPGTRTLLTEIDVPNREGHLTPGTYCEVELQIPRKTESLIVPAEAVIFSRKGLSVAIVENGSVHLRELTVARDRGTTLEVTAGVKDGDQVIINPPGDISEGRVVRPQLVEAPNG
jgi:hypothetical protein